MDAICAMLPIPRPSPGKAKVDSRVEYSHFPRPLAIIVKRMELRLMQYAHSVVMANAYAFFFRTPKYLPIFLAFHWLVQLALYKIYCFLSFESI